MVILASNKGISLPHTKDYLGSFSASETQAHLFYKDFIIYFLFFHTSNPIMIKKKERGFYEKI